MKKSLALTLVFAMLFSFCLSVNFTTAQADDAADTPDKKYTFSDRLSWSDLGGNAGHGGHQTRVVHTSHGDYLTYITKSLGGVGSSSGGTASQLDYFEVKRINEDGTTDVVFGEFKIYDSSQVGLFVDKDENVWVMTVGDNKYKYVNGQDAIYANAWMIDKETDDVTNYNIIVPRKTWSGYGYSYFCYDEANNKIYTLTSSGDEPGELVWLIFDMETKTWDNTARSIKTKYRNCYPYIYADGNGGMIIVNECDHKASTAGYPEISNNNGLSDEELSTFSRWSADYVWDQIELYYIENVYDTKYEGEQENITEPSYIVAEADYSKVNGTQDERNSLEYRKVNQYPNFQNNNGGDTFLDNEGKLHVIYAKEYLLSAYTRARTHRYWYHDVLDISEPSNIKLLSSTFLIDDGADCEYNYSYRMYQESDGTLYLISGRTGKNGSSVGYCIGDIRVLEATATDDGYEYKEVAKQDIGGDSVICISNSRSNSTEDDKLAIVWIGSEGSQYRYHSLTISCNHDLEYEHDENQHWQVCKKDDCGYVSDKAAHEFTWVTDTPATKLDTGVKHEDCVCGVTRNEDTVIDKLDCEHENLGDWEYDDDKHWKTCPDCENTFNEGEHKFEWVTDVEATVSEEGVKHEECECGATRNENTPIDKLEEPELGENDMLFWMLLVVSVASLAGVALMLNKRKKAVK